jgi:hypothetical protein
LRLDIIHGWMQISILISHVAGSVFAWGTHAAWGLSDSSEQFIFLSGLTLGSVFTLKARRDGLPRAQDDLLRRALRLYATQMKLFFGFAAMVLLGAALLSDGDALRRGGWCLLVDAPCPAAKPSSPTSPATLEQQQVAAVSGVTQDFFSEALQAEIVNSGKNLLVFVHGFANSYSDAMCRAAFNREWFATSNVTAADCCVVAFTWPSAGRVVDGEDVLAGAATILLTVLGLAISHELKSPFTNRYHDDQNNARSSGRDFARTLDRMAPLAEQARAQGLKVFLLAHSMGHVVLQGSLRRLGQ